MTVRAPRRRAPFLLLVPAGMAAGIAVMPILYLLDRAGSLGWERAWRELY